MVAVVKSGNLRKGRHKIIFRKFVSMIVSSHKTGGNKNHITCHMLKLDLNIFLDMKVGHGTPRKVLVNAMPA